MSIHEKSAATLQGDDYDDSVRQMDKVVWRKLDTRILPVVAMFYLLSFLDRTNIGNARIAGLQEDLGLTNSQYSMALTVTYIPYIAAELPSNLLLHVVGPNYMLPVMLTLWGIATTLQGLVTNYRGLLAARFFIGLFEGGMFPGLALYLSMFYPRSKMNMRTAVFFSSASFSGAFSGILAYGIIQIKSSARPSWAWIFVIEGAFTAIFGICSLWLLPRSIKTVKFLSQTEKEFVIEILETDGTISKDDGFKWREILKTVVAPHVVMLSIIFFFSGVVLFGLAFFTPSIVVSLGYTAARAQLMSVPPFASAFIVTLVVSFISDRYQCRGLIVIVTSLLCAIGFSMFLGSTNHRIQYASLFFSVSGIYSMVPALSAWTSNNSAPHIRRATSIALVFMMGNFGGILSTWLLGEVSAAPRYFSATILLLGCSVGMVVVAVANWLYLRRQNARKGEMRRQIVGVDIEGGSHLEEQGDDSLGFVYML